MKHCRGIDLTRRSESSSEVDSALAHLTFASLREWHVIGARCGQCERGGWLDRWDLARRYGSDCSLGSLAHRLRCRKCGNEVGNRFMFGQQAR